MPSPLEPLDISLLRHDKSVFLIRCQPIIELTVKYYISKKMFTTHQYSDLVQSVNERLIKKLNGIEKNFDGSVQMVTYISVVIRNICRTLYEIEINKIPLVQLPAIDQMVEGEIENKLLIDDELKRLSLILDLYDSSRKKIIIMMKIYYRMPLTRPEIRAFFRKVNTTDRNEIFARFGGEYNDTYETDNFNFLSNALFQQEGKRLSGDSLRRWIERKIHDIIDLLNGNPPSHSFTLETIRILFEHYIEQES